MSSESSLITDSDFYEEYVNLSVSDASMSFAMFDDHHEPISAGLRSEFPECSLIASSVQNSEEIERLQHENKQMKNAIKKRVNKLKTFSKLFILDEHDNYLNVPRNTSYFAPSEVCSKYSRSEIFSRIDCAAFEVCEDINNLNYVFKTVKTLNETLIDTRKNLEKGLESVEKITKENNSLQDKLDKVTRDLCYNLLLDTEEIKPEASCRCIFF